MERLPDRLGLHRRGQRGHHRFLLHDSVGAVLGLCLVDTWFGPIYAESVALPEKSFPAREKEESMLVGRR